MVEFRSGKCNILLEEGDPILFALGKRHRRKGKDTLVFVRVSKAPELLPVEEAMRRYPDEADECNLKDLARAWGVSFVYCIPLDKESIRDAHEMRNLSGGVLGFVHQIAYDTGIPHFCHKDDEGKTVPFARRDGTIVDITFRTALLDCASKVCDARGGRAAANDSDKTTPAADVETSHAKTPSAADIAGGGPLMSPGAGRAADVETPHAKKPSAADVAGGGPLMSPGAGRVEGMYPSSE